VRFKSLVGADQDVSARAGQGTASRSDGAERDRVVELAVARAEVAILQAGIDVGTQRHTKTGEDLPREAAVVVAQFLDLGDTDAGAEEAVNAIIRAHVDQTIDHAGQDADVMVGIEIPADESVARLAVDRVDELSRAEQRVVLGPLVTELALDPEQAEVVTGVEVDVVAGFVFDPAEPIDGNVGICGVGEINGSVDVALQREERAEIGADVT